MDHILPVQNRWAPSRDTNLCSGFLTTIEFEWERGKVVLID